MRPGRCCWCCWAAPARFPRVMAKGTHGKSSAIVRSSRNGAGLLCGLPAAGGQHLRPYSRHLQSERVSTVLNVCWHYFGFAHSGCFRNCSCQRSHAVVYEQSLYTSARPHGKRILHHIGTQAADLGPFSMVRLGALGGLVWMRQVVNDYVTDLWSTHLWCVAAWAPRSDPCAWCAPSSRSLQDSAYAASR